jgi:hypothetical protein
MRLVSSQLTWITEGRKRLSRIARCAAASFAQDRLVWRWRRDGRNLPHHRLLSWACVGMVECSPCMMKRMMAYIEWEVERRGPVVLRLYHSTPRIWV